MPTLMAGFAASNHPRTTRLLCVYSSPDVNVKSLMVKPLFGVLRVN